MMKVQLIGTNLRSSQEPTITITPIDAPKSMDEFDVNVFDLTGQDLWKNKNNTRDTIDKISDFLSIQTMIEKKSKAKVVIVCPQNVTYYYNGYREQGHQRYYSSTPIKDIIRQICSGVLSKIAPPNSFPLKLLYENTHTTISGKAYEAAFYFDSNDRTLTQSDFSQKPTTVALTDNDVYATTLKITNSIEELKVFLNSLFTQKSAETAPEWFTAVVFGDDDQQKELILRKEREIEEASLSIKTANEKLAQNARYKSILYTNGGELVEVVFDILEQLLGCDLSDFEDKKKEDFLIETDQYILIGEIKGVTSNVRRDNISQIDNHYNGYLDDHPGIDAAKVHQMLIINPLRKQKPDEREPVHEDQIHLAQRNGCLIVETDTLLRLFELFQKGAVSVEQCIGAFSNVTGLLKLGDIVRGSDEDMEPYRV